MAMRVIKQASLLRPMLGEREWRDERRGYSIALRVAVDTKVSTLFFKEVLQAKDLYGNGIEDGKSPLT